MKKIIASTLLALCISSIALAGDIPGNGPTPPCTQNCMKAEQEPQPLLVPDVTPDPSLVSITEFVMGMVALVF